MQLFNSKLRPTAATSRINSFKSRIRPLGKSELRQLVYALINSASFRGHSRTIVKVLIDSIDSSGFDSVLDVLFELRDKGYAANLNYSKYPHMLIEISWNGIGK